MKIKQRPEDFQVEELTDVRPGDAGPFAFYRLEKKGWSTHDALAAVRRRWQIDARRLAYGGLKDRHAHTVQYLTIFRGPKRKLAHHQVHVEYLGQVREPYSSKDIRANRFALTVRDLNDAELPAARAAVTAVARDGLPNYFDDQRFGSLESENGSFIARAWVLDQYEDALKLALTAPYEYDRAPEKREKQVLRECWGNWPQCKQQLEKGHARSLVTYLVDHPTDFRGALRRLRPELASLYLSAYQSHLWNRMLTGYLRATLREEQLLTLSLRAGDVVLVKALDDEQRAALHKLELPLPSARLKLDEQDPRRPLIERVLADEGLTLERLKIRGERTPFFSRGERPAWFTPRGLNGEPDVDELNQDRHKLTLSFELPRGAYATLLVKRIEAGHS